MSSGKVLLGTDYVIAQNERQNTDFKGKSGDGYAWSWDDPVYDRVTLTPTLCSNLSAFKTLLRSSRQLDDAIPIRLNRESALSAESNLSPQSCDRFWKELRTSWAERGKLIGYCEQAMRPKVEGAVKAGEVEDRLSVGREQKEEEERRRGRGQTEQEVKRRQIANELQVESIIRSRSLAMFQSRCPYHPQDPPAPPLPVSLDDEVEREDRQRHRGRDGRGGVRWNG